MSVKKNKSSNNLLKLILLIYSAISIISCSNHNYNKNKLNKHNNTKEHHIDSLTFYGEHVTPQKEQELLSKNIIYFGYDQDDISYNYDLILLAHTKHMLQNSNLTLRIDGHTDERGSSEYNIGLGERRAKAVIKFMESRGIPSYRLVAVSYGKEKPAVSGHNEGAWRHNRRAELHYE